MYRHHVERRVHLCVPMVRNIPNPTEVHWRDQDYAHKFGCIARKTYQRLLERRRGSNVVGFMDRIHDVHVFEWKTSSRIFVIQGKGLTKIQATTRPDYVWPEIWSGMSKAAEKKEKQEWTIEKPKLDNARKLRDIYFIKPEDGEYKEITKKNSRKSWKFWWRQSCLASWRRRRAQRDCGKPQARQQRSNKVHKTMHASIVEAHESTRKRLESTPPRSHEDHIAEKGFNSISHDNSEHKFIPMLQAMKILDAKAAVNKEWEKLDKGASMTIGHGKEQNEGHPGSTQRKKKSTLLLWWTCVTWR